MAGFVGVLMLVAGCAGLAWLGTYQPLVYGSSHYVPGATAVSTIGLGTEYQFLATRAGTFDVWVQIKNTGPRSVTLLDVVRDRSYYWRLREAALGIHGPEPGGSTGREFVPFSPQRLRPGDFLQLRLRYEFADCAMDGAASSFASFGVRYSPVFFVQREARIKFPFSVGIQSIGGDCGENAFRPV